MKVSVKMSSKITYSSLPVQVKRIAQESLGRGVLQSLFNYNTDYHILIKIEDGETIGFALYHFNTEELESGKNYITGVIDCICVSTRYRNEGYGTKLTVGVLRKMAAKNVSRIELMLKKPVIEDRDSEPGFPIRGSEELLIDLGFRKVMEYKSYYSGNSKDSKYECIFCGNNSDTCTGVLYAINERG